jgi:hypothetical protein
MSPALRLFIWTHIILIKSGARRACSPFLANSLAPIARFLGKQDSIKQAQEAFGAGQLRPKPPHNTYRDVAIWNKKHFEFCIRTPSVPPASIIWLARAVNVVRRATRRLHIDCAPFAKKKDYA